MKVQSETIEVEITSRAVDGTKLEPEEKAIRHTLEVATDVGVGYGPNDPERKPLDQAFRSKIINDTNVGEVAQQQLTRCAHCQHFNQEAWYKLYNVWRDPIHKEGHAQLQQLRGAVLDRQLKPGEMLTSEAESKADQMLAHMGICEAMSEIFNDVVTITYDAGCPKDVGPRGEDLSSLFRIRDREAKVEASKTFDAIMRIAQGKID